MQPPSSSPPPSVPPTPPPPLPQPSVSPAAVPRRTGTGWKITVVILVVLLGISFLGHLTSLLRGLVSSSGGAYRTSKTPLQEVVLEDNSSRHKVVLLPLEGLIMDQGIGGARPGLVRLVKDQLEAAGEDPRVRAVILKVSSPGGEVLASDEISQAIGDFQKESGKPVIAAMGSLAASGGYYVSAPCRWIVAHELTITGSIGVIMQSYNYRGLMDKIGVRPEVFKSGKFKDMLSGGKKEEDITEEERAMVQRLVDQTFERFKEVVQRGRSLAFEENKKNPQNKGRALVEDWEDYADGRILSGREAYERGFVDELGDLDTAVERATNLAGIHSANLVQYRQVFDLSSFFELFGQSAKARTVRVDWGVEPPHLEPGRLYFLSPNYVR